jgi:hypothetical protein
MTEKTEKTEKTKVKTETTILPIGSVVIDKELYPRLFVDYVTVARYTGAMKAGDIFPPITVAELGGKNYLVDGNHRLTSLKGLKETHITVEVLKGLTRKQIYDEAVKRNVTHGKQFSTQEVTNIIITLEKWGTSLEQISEIVRIPMEEIKPFVLKRMTRIIGNDGEEQDIALKASLQNLSGFQNEEPRQEKMIGNSQTRILEAVIALIKNDYVELGDEHTVELLVKLQKLLGKYLEEKFPQSKVNIKNLK